MLKKLYIEPTTKCNLNCKMCFRNTWFDEPICDLSLEDFRRVIDTMPPTVETIFFGGMGEPLFHRDILAMIRIAAETGADVLDVNSSLEDAPGHKSMEKLKELITTYQGVPK